MPKFKVLMSKNCVTFTKTVTCDKFDSIILNQLQENGDIVEKVDGVPLCFYGATKEEITKELKRIGCNEKQIAAHLKSAGY